MWTEKAEQTKPIKSRPVFQQWWEERTQNHAHNYNPSYLGV